jgi:acyl dehydratase
MLLYRQQLRLGRLCSNRSSGSNSSFGAGNVTTRRCYRRRGRHHTRFCYDNNNSNHHHQQQQLLLFQKLQQHYTLYPLPQRHSRWISSTSNPSSLLPTNATDDVIDDVDPTDAAAVTTTTSQETDDTLLLLTNGMIFDHAIDVRSALPGDHIDVPYELTITDTIADLWFTCFFDHSRIHGSRPFCRSMGLQDRVIPFTLALFLTSSMTHADAAKVQVGFGKVHYLWPIFAGDTVRKTFTVHKVRNTSDGKHSVVHFNCTLINQRGRVCMQAEKRMLFQFPSIAGGPNHTPSDTMTNNNSSDDDGTSNVHLFRDHILSMATTALARRPSQSLAKLRPGQLIFHTMHRSLPFSTSQQLASLVRLTHERHFDSYKYDVRTEILVPGGLVLGLTLSAAARDLHEVLHEEIRYCHYVNALQPDTVVGAISYIGAIDDNLPGDLELVTVTTLGIKNLNVQRDLLNIGIPKRLFEPGLYSKEIELICKEMCPILSEKIIVQVERRILRQATHKEVFLL